jgi:LAGLIDADG endonuclease
MLPNYSRKWISGWTNHSGMVTRHEIERNEMGNRVTKSNPLYCTRNNSFKFSSVFVKVQRADGSWLLKNNLRCALLVFEKYYITKILSNRSLTKKINHLNNQLDYKLNWVITGLTDAEGAFMIKIRKLPSLRAGWAIEPSFEISLHLKDLDLLNQIRNYFGNISTVRIRNDKKTCVFSVRSLDDIVSTIIPHFDNYPLITKKKADYLLFKEVILMMQQKEHLTKEGVENILNIRATMNIGLTPALKEAFPFCVPVLRPVVNNLITSLEVWSPKWMLGFASGEGCFSIILIHNKDKTRTDVQLKYSISQHRRDKELIESFISYFNCGHIAESRGCIYFYVVKFSDIYEKIIPFFNENKILGVKSEDYHNWCEAAELMKQSKHLTKDGINQIIKIKQGMNKNRPIKETKE